jgi:FkbM family methyltransferase
LKVIYDFGANSGGNIPYYLKKADIVVAVEAIPSLCEKIEKRFYAEIKSDRLVLKNCVLNTDRNAKESLFYIHKYIDGFSQFTTPNQDDLHYFRQILLPSLSPAEIIQKYGPPHYIKIDVEGYDQEVIRHLFENSIFPTFISAESLSAEVFCLLVACGKYNAFKLVDGASIGRLYNNAQITTNKGIENYCFPHYSPGPFGEDLQSAGPFGEDIKGEWMAAGDLMRLLGFVGYGWKDIHATNVINTPKPNLRLRSLFKKALIHRVLRRSGGFDAQ